MLFDPNALAREHVDEENEKALKKDYDFSKSNDMLVVAPKGKTRINIYIDNDILEEFHRSADETV